MLRNSAYVLSKLILKLSEVFEIVLSTETVCCYKTFASQGFLSDLMGLCWLLLHVIIGVKGGKLIFDRSSAKHIFTQKFKSPGFEIETPDKLKSWYFLSWHLIEDPFKIQVLIAK